MKILIGIPAYNEEQMIGKVLQSLPKKIGNKHKVDKLVVDDGSADQTSAIAKAEKAISLRHLLNRGLGGAIKTIFAYAKAYNYDILLTFDADGQHITEDIPKVLAPILKNEADVVVGSRWRSKTSRPILRFLINQFANIITYFFFGLWTNDSQSGLRAFNKKSIQLINLETDGMEVSSEFFREIHKHKLTFTEVPINVIYTSYSKAKGQKLSNAPNVFFQLLLRLLR
jgi:glycosyltransferase involved in cell wall biosynthesis